MTLFVHCLNHMLLCSKFLKSESISLPTLFFFLRIILRILGGSLEISYEFQIQLVNFYKEFRWDSDSVCAESVKQFGEYCHFNNGKSSAMNVGYFSILNL